MRPLEGSNDRPIKPRSLSLRSLRPLEGSNGRPIKPRSLSPSKGRFILCGPVERQTVVIQDSQRNKTCKAVILWQPLFFAFTKRLPRCDSPTKTNGVPFFSGISNRFNSFPEGNPSTKKTIILKIIFPVSKKKLFLQSA